MVSEQYDAVIVGGGFYGCSLALHLQRAQELRVLVVELGPDLLLRASYANQARVHNGYHYPRSLLTGLRSRVNFPRFSQDYRDCIDQTFEKYYAVGRILSNVTAGQFRLFCERIGAPAERATARVRALFNPDLIEDVFLVRETAFDANRLRHRLATELVDAGVEVRLSTEALRLSPAGEGRLAVQLRSAAGDSTVSARRVFNCTYSRINRLLSNSGLPAIPLKHELTEIALIEVPDALRHIGITVMCGPFFSLMPFPAAGLHSLSHVRYTPHCAWQDTETGPNHDPYAMLAALPRRSRQLRMLKDAARYLPAAAECHYRESLWEVKTVLPRSEVDDSRPILLKVDSQVPRLTSVMGSKIDNVYDMLESSPFPPDR